MDTNVYEITCHNPETDAPRWLLRAYQQGPTIFLPAGAVGDEQQAILMAAWDGNIPCVVAPDGHAYLPSAFLQDNFPAAQADLARVEALIRAHIGKEPPCPTP